jgi:hypothetical protein
MSLQILVKTGKARATSTQRFPSAQEKHPPSTQAKAQPSEAAK